MDFAPVMRSSVLSQFNLRTFEVNQDFIVKRQLVMEVGGGEKSGLVEMICVVHERYDKWEKDK